MLDTILLVEDDADVLKANVRLLQRRNYNVLTARTVADATRILKQDTPDLLVLDIMLPDGSGYDVCKIFREHTDKPVIFLSAKGNVENIVAGLKCGADYYLTKPYNIDEFFAIIERLLEREHKNSEKKSNIYSVGKLSINLATSTVTLAGNVVNLTKIEFALLSYLMQNKNKEILDQDLCNAAWCNLSHDNKPALKTHISRIRHKIDCENSESYDIRAIYGKGYSLITV